MKVLVTGANGHIGANVVRACLDKGHQVRAFVRKSADVQGIEGLDIETVHGDVMDVDSLKPAAEGCDAIIHLAAVYKTIAKTPEEIVEPAVKGSKNIFEAAKEAGIKRIVYTSSIASIGFSTSADKMRTANDWNDDAENPYYVAKTQSEKVAQQLSKEYDIDVIVICPAIVVGPYDYRVTPSNQLVKDWLNGIGITYKGGINLVDVRDVAAIHVEALEKGENRQRYVAGGDNIEVKDIGLMLKKMTGIKPMHMPTPRWMTLMSASLMEAFCKLFGLTPLFTRDLVYEVIERWGFYDCSKTIETFGIQPKSGEECLQASIDWLKSQGKFKESVNKKLDSMS